MKKGEKGGLYIAGQRFEYNGDYNGLENMVFFLKEKPPINVLDPSRDRTTLKRAELKAIVAWACRGSNTITKEQRLQLIKAFEPHWSKGQLSDVGAVLDTILTQETYRMDTLHINFPENYVAYSNADDAIKQTLINNGYEICQSGFSSLGMKTIAEVYGEARKHEPLQPNAQQERRIIILKEAIKKLSEAMKKNGFSDTEIDAHIHLFDRQAPKEALHRDALAEAIVENGTSKGFWIDHTYLSESSFGHVLETALHELSHKVGGDSTAAFSYKLTDVNASLIEELMRNPSTRHEFQALSALWNEAV